MIYLKLLVLVIVANGTPILGHVVFKSRWAYPLDFGWKFFDGNPILGPSKTIRGLLLSIFITTFFAPWLGLSFQVGFVLSASSMVGDCLSSFTKRRFGMKSESQAFGLDQIPESLIPLLVLQSTYRLELGGIILTVIAFIILEIIFSRVLFLLKLRKHPY